MHELKEINGNEIIKFLNKKLEDKGEDENLCDISVGAPLVFVEQKIEYGVYILCFNAYFNNWGTDQEIFGNEISIDKKGKVSFCLSEPFDGDGSDEVLEEILTEWLKTHAFNKSPEESFYKLIQESFEELGYIKYSDGKYLQKIIDRLIEAKTYIK